MMMFLAAVCAAGAVGTLSWKVIHPRRSPLARISPYTEVARARLGVRVESVPHPVLVSEAARRLLGPLAGAATGWVARLLKVADTKTIQTRLRQAGSRMTVEDYRRAHLRWTIITPLILAALGAALGSATLAVVFAALGAFGGARRMPDQLRKLARGRAARARSDLPVIAGILAPKIQNNKSLAVAVQAVVRDGSGPVIDDLAHALHTSSAGVGLAESFELIAEQTVEPAAARFYRFLATATTGAIDLPAALLEQADQLRAQRREEVERAATARQISMVIPTLVLMVPVAIVFLLAPLPKMLFGI